MASLELRHILKPDYVTEQIHFKPVKIYNQPFLPIVWRNGEVFLYAVKYIEYFVPWEMAHQCTDLVLTSSKIRPRVLSSAVDRIHTPKHKQNIINIRKYFLLKKAG